MKWRKYILSLMVGIVVFGAGVISFNMIVDPYHIWNIYSKIGVNYYSIKDSSLERIVKPIRFLQYQPDTVFFGESTLNYSINPDYYTELTGKSSYNLSINAARIYEIRRYVEYAAMNDKNLKHVIVGLEFNQFLDAKPLPSTMPGFDEVQLSQKHITGDNFCKMTFSLQACEDSFQTILENRSHRYEYRTYTDRGKLTDERVASIYDASDFFGEMRDWHSREGFLRDVTLSNERLDELRYIVNFCKENNIKLTLFIPPYHSILMEALLGKLPTIYDEWERQIVQIAPVMDFTSYNDITMSRDMPNPFFWNAWHMKSSLGNLVIDRLAGNLSANMPDDFGIMVTPANVDVHLQRIHQAHEAWRGSNAELIDEIRYTEGFIELPPRELQRMQVEQNNSIIHLDHIAGVDDVKSETVVRISRGNGFRISGWSLTELGKIERRYGVLENERGDCYYTLLCKFPRPDLVKSLHHADCIQAGFIIWTGAAYVPNGSYAFRIMECSKERLYISDLLAKVEVVD